jgi:hypothetical protein
LIFIGAVLRMIWPLDFEWKADEKWAYDVAVRTIREEAPFPWLGMVSSVGVDNPGMTIWPFIGLAVLFQTPAAMTLSVMVLNALALGALALWVWYGWPEEDRSLGLWGIALFAVSPIPVLFSRKLWPQNLFPIFFLPWIWSYARRERPGAAFLWGVAGMFLGQLHMSGFFAAAGLVLATLMTARKGVAWAPWAAGTACGLLPMLPWARQLLTHRPAMAGQKVISLDYFLLAFKNAWGLGLDYSLGSEMGIFLDGPVVAGRSTGLLRATQVALWILVPIALFLLWRDRRSLRFPAFFAPCVWGVLIGGALLHLLFVRVYTHYLVVWGPILGVMAAWVFSRRPRWLVAFAVLQLFMTTGFLWYVHEKGGVKDGDFGPTYRVQRQQKPEPASE